MEQRATGGGGSAWPRDARGSSAARAVSVAIVHDYLTQRGGAERVVLAIARAFPGAPIHTSLFDPRTTFPQFRAMDVRPLALDRVPGLRGRHRLALPLLAPAFSALTVDADVVVCSSSGWAHGVATHGRKVVYCHNPARWLYQRGEYTRTVSAARLVAAVAGPPLRRWDRRSAHGAERYLVNSTVVRARVRAAYGITAEIVPPPYGLGPDGSARAVDGLAPGFFLCVSRLVPYKHVDAVVEAFAGLTSERLVVVGDGPDRARVARLAGPSVRLLGAVDDDRLRWLYANCRAVVAASYEDFGLTPVEAAAFGKPTAALRGGGYLDTVVDGRTGVFFAEPTASAIRDAVERLCQLAWDEAAIAGHAAAYSPARFAECLRELLRPEAPASRAALGRAEVLGAVDGPG
jgi:glycosyltransferase involved in cell wall biosynthesis